MSYSISTLLLRNLSDVFGENDPVRRRAAIPWLDCTSLGFWAIQRKKQPTVSTRATPTPSQRSARNEAGHRRRGLNSMPCADQRAPC